MNTQSMLKRSSLAALDLMSRNVAAVCPDWTIAELATFLDNRGISGALVQGPDGRPLGVVSVSDISSAEALDGRTPTSSARHSPFYAQNWETEFDESDGEQIRIEESELTVADVMTPQVVSVPADASVEEVANTMLYQHIHRVFVGDEDTILGLITTTDLITLLATPDEG